MLGVVSQLVRPSVGFAVQPCTLRSIAWSTPWFRSQVE